MLPFEGDILQKNIEFWKQIKKNMPEIHAYRGVPTAENAHLEGAGPLTQAGFMFYGIGDPATAQTYFSLAQHAAIHELQEQGVAVILNEDQTYTISRLDCNTFITPNIVYRGLNDLFEATWLATGIMPPQSWSAAILPQILNDLNGETYYINDIDVLLDLAIHGKADEARAIMAFHVDYFDILAREYPAACVDTIINKILRNGFAPDPMLAEGLRFWSTYSKHFEDTSVEFWMDATDYSWMDDVPHVPQLQQLFWSYLDLRYRNHGVEPSLDAIIDNIRGFSLDLL